MNKQTERELLALNQRFYNEFSNAFATTRRRIQPGVSRVLETIPREVPSDWLDLGCGSGALGQIWAGQDRKGSYTGLDFSEGLLREAEKATAGLSGGQLCLRYVQGDLMDQEWTSAAGNQSYDGVLAFASLHHIPGRENHQRIFSEVYRLLKGGGRFIFSVWQFQNSPKLMQRVQPWSLVNLSENDLEPGDTLLDWRYSLPENQGQPGLRYVHLFSESELDELARMSGFHITDRFYSDGAEGNLAYYCELKKDH